LGGVFLANQLFTKDNNLNQDEDFESFDNEKKDRRIYETPYRICNCDDCGVDDVYVKAGHDSWGEHIWDSCFYGCGDLRNKPNEMIEEIIIVSVEMIDKVECYDSKWCITAIIGGENKVFTITRFNTENEERLREKLQNCKNQKDITRLHQFVVYN
jgi:hypothetical protein